MRKSTRSLAIKLHCCVSDSHAQYTLAAVTLRVHTELYYHAIH